MVRPPTMKTRTLPTVFAALIASSPASAGVGVLQLDPANPPARRSQNTWSFSGHDFEVANGVVVQLQPQAIAPSGSVHLGGPSYRIPTSTPEAAIALALKLAANASDQGLTSVFPDLRTHRKVSSLDLNDPGFGGQWYLEELEIETVWEQTRGDPTIRVAVIDSGIEIANDDLEPAVIEPFDAFAGDEDPSPEPGEYCSGGGTGICDEHGTAVAGIVAARANNGSGIAGICHECSLIPIRMLGEGAGLLSADVAAFEHAIAADAAVINNSWGFVSPIAVPEPLAQVIDRAANEPRGGLGALVVFAAGNDDRELEDDELTALPGVLCVSATDSYGSPTAYTNYGDSVDLAAPSATVSIAPQGEITTTFGGTSAAAPVVSGLAGLAFSFRPDLSAAELASLFVETATQSPLITPDESGHHPKYGYGNVNPVALFEALSPSETDTGGPDSGPTSDGRASEAKGESGGCQGVPPPEGWASLGGVLLGILTRTRWIRRDPGGPRPRAGA
jgi:serine protease